jgi:hypothetical protein
MSLDGVEAKAKEKYGAAARVLSAEEVRVGGIGGFFARRFLDVIVDVPDAAAPAQHWTALRQPDARQPGSRATARRSAIDDLIERADKNDTPITAAAVPPLSTESEAFTDVLADLRRYAAATGPVGQSHRKTKRPVVLLRAPGDLVVIAGIGNDALIVATALAAETPVAQVAVGGAILEVGTARVGDRRTAFAARARGVENGRATIVAYGIDPGDVEFGADMASLSGIRPDQLWLAVDASRKPEDTQRWVMALSTALPVQAIAVVRSAWTSTPDSVRSLGLPEGWSDAVG